MNNVERMFFEQMQDDKFQNAVHDDFSFVDSLVDKTDLERLDISEEEY